MKRTTITLLSAWLAIATGCKNKVLTNKELLGSWQNKNQARLTFEPNGKFQGEKLLISSFWNHEYGKAIFRGQGIWKLEDSQSGTIILNFKNTSIPDLRGGFNSQIMFDRANDTWRLYQWEEEEGGNKYEFYKIF